MAFGKQGTINKESQKKLQEERQAALFGNNVASEEIQFPRNTLVNMPIELIDVHPDNKEVFEVKDIPQLANQIKKVGYDISKPLTLYEKEDGRYEIISGERRFTAASMAGLKVIPAIIKKDSTEEADKAGELIDSNFFDREKSYLEKARAMAYWRDNYLIPKEGPDNTDEKICEHFNIKISTLKNYWKILSLINELQELCFYQSFPSSVLAMLNVQTFSPEEQKEIYEEIKKNINFEDENWKMSSRQLTDIIEAFKKRRLYNNRIEHNKKILNHSNEITSDDEIKNNENVSKNTKFKTQSIDEFEKSVNQPILKELSFTANKNNGISTGSGAPSINNRNMNYDEPKPVQIIRKPDLNKILSIIDEQLQSITTSNYEIMDIEKTEQIIISSMKKLNELKDAIAEKK